MPVNIAVLDAGAHLKAFVRMDGAVLGSIDVAMKKAQDGRPLRRTSEAVWEYCEPGAPATASSIERRPRTLRGRDAARAAAGETLGAVGISGGTLPRISRSPRPPAQR